MHRFVLAEFNTHRVFSRNSASSRAIPLAKQIEKVKADPAIPVEWATEKSGMSGGEPLEGYDAEHAEALWKAARTFMANIAEDLGKIGGDDKGVHKSIANRLLEPFMSHTVIVTATEWDGFFAQRVSPYAQPEIRVAAEEMLRVFNESTPVRLDYGDWHTPYILDEEYEQLDLEDRKKISAARCARVSYLTHDGVRDWLKDFELFDRLTSADPPHASPLEHVCTPAHPADPAHLGNLLGWHQLRHAYWPTYPPTDGMVIERMI